MIEERRFPVSNKGTEPIEIAIEPDGDCFELAVGEKIELRYEETPGDDQVVIEGSRITFWFGHFYVEIWQNGKRIRYSGP